MEEETRHRKREVVIAGISVVLAIVLVVAAVFAVQHALDEEYHRTHFEEGTQIQDVDCSDLTVEEAKELIEEKEVELQFADGHSISVSGNEIGREINSTAELESFLSQQRSEDGQDAKNFTLSEDAFCVDEAKMEEYLKGLDELKAENMHQPKNAYMYIGEDGLVKIQDEVYGNVIDFEEACTFVKEELQSGEENIFFLFITDLNPEITSRDLNDAMEEVNTALQTVIKFELRDGSFFNLDYSVMKDWLYQDDEGIYHLAIDENLPEFLESMNEQVQKLGASMDFTTEDGETFSLLVPIQNRDKVDIEAEIAQIKAELQEGGYHQPRKPIYSRFNSQEDFDTFVEIWLEKQRVRLYVNRELIKDAPCITGDVKTHSETPPGVFYPTVITTDYHMTLYECDVAFWVAFYGHIGLHDADNWRSDTEYVPTAYINDGSHGCVNMIEVDIAVMYPYITYDTPIVVHP